jgi:A/G-specific adenine glycosylase
LILINEFHKLFQENGLTSNLIEKFREIIYSFYRNNKRNFPFRENLTPYKVLVSELMLQQTQTNRVSEKYLEFISKFPNFKSLAEAPLDEVLKIWHGLGYNRRAIALKKIAERVINDYQGELPNDLTTLKSFPQIGHNTASSIIAFAFNRPSYFVETNIRCVYFYFFFPEEKNVKDDEILNLVQQTIDSTNPREWFYALMDYGAMLKKKFPDLNKKSAHYRKQTNFKGSSRQLRGKILSLLVTESLLTKNQLVEKTRTSTNLVDKLLKTLIKEGFIKKEGSGYFISN